MDGSIWLHAPPQSLVHTLLTPAGFNTFNGSFQRFSLRAAPGLCIFFFTDL